MKFDDAPAHPVYSEAVYARDQFGWSPLRTLRIGQFKFIDAPRAELYDLAKDPRELTNILRTNAAEVTTLRSELTKLLARYPSSAKPAPTDTSATPSALQSLGYLAGTQHAAVTGVDPKDRIAEFQLFEKSLDAFDAGRIDAAIAGMQRVLALDPASTPAKQALAEYEKLRKK